MKSLDEIFAEGRLPDEIINDLMSCSKNAVPWSKLVDLYDANKHPIKTDPALRPKDKTMEDGQRDCAAKIAYPAEQIAVRRMVQMAFSIPVKRVYDYDQKNEAQKAFVDAIEKVYDAVRINGVNMKRMKAYFASCEMATVWYLTDGDGEEHEKYGFPTTAKIRCRSYSPMPTKMSEIYQADIYPLFDHTGDLIALSFRYAIDVAGKTIEKFDCLTAQTAYYWSQEEGVWELTEKQNVIGKISAAYISKSQPIYAGIADFRDEIEFANSRNSDVVKKNSSPIIVVSGALKGQPPANGRGREAYQVENGGSVNLLNPALSSTEVKAHINTQKEFIAEVTQMPNLSMENIKSLGAISGEARKTLLTDSHLKVGEEAHDLVWFFDREFSVIKSIVATAHTAWKPFVNKVSCKHIITPFIQNDQDAQTNRLSKQVDARLISRRTAIGQLEDIANVEEELARIQEESMMDIEMQRSVSNFEGAY